MDSTIMYDIFLDKLSTILLDGIVDGIFDLEMESVDFWGEIPNGYREIDKFGEEAAFYYEFLDVVDKSYFEHQMEVNKLMLELQRVA